MIFTIEFFRIRLNDDAHVIDLDRERLKNASRYGVGEEPFADPAFGQRLGDYYGAR